MRPRPQWRWVEHAWWVVFEDFFIILATLKGLQEMRAIAESRAATGTG